MQKQRKRTKENVVGGILDAVDHRCELARIPKTVVSILTSFFVSKESSVDLIFAPTYATQLTKLRLLNVVGPGELLPYRRRSDVYLEGSPSKK